jgi:hypothetical protein
MKFLKLKEKLIPIICLLILITPVWISAGADFFKDLETIFEISGNLENAGSFSRQLALEKSKDIKGVYLTGFTGSSNSKGAENLRRNIKTLLETTELNGVVIDVKEVEGTYFSATLEKFVKELEEDGFWTIARVAGFRDSFALKEHPDWYIKNEDGSLWEDGSGYYWLDPACSEVSEYLLEVSKKAADSGFDEIQFDYVRYPADSDLTENNFPCTREERTKAINSVYLALSGGLRSYKTDIVLSIDVFGMTSLYIETPNLGQTLKDIAGKFDYVSPMVYPSHYFQGFSVKADPKRGLPYLFFPYEDEDPNKVSSNHPYEIVSRSLFPASDYLSSLKEEDSGPKIKEYDHFSFEMIRDYWDQYLEFLNSSFDVDTQIRPWLQHFDLKADREKGVFYGPDKIRLQIEAAQDSGSKGWLLWNPTNVYYEEALNQP